MTAFNKKSGLAFLLGALPVLFLVCAARARADDTTVVVWDRQPLYSSYRVDFTRLMMPDARKKYKRITMTYTLECPRFGCDPWDRPAEIFILDSAKAAPYSTDDLNPLFFDVPRYPLGMLITPYGQGWSWKFDVTHLRPLLHDSVTFGTYITTSVWTNHHEEGAVGFLASMSLHFEEGDPDFLETRVDTLWRGSFHYGLPEDPIEEHLTPITLHPEESFAVAWILSFGNGQGNTDNAGEFAKKLHTLKVGNGEAVFARIPWRDDCDKLPVGEQYGSWQHARAGFCPGAEIIPWENDLSNFIRPGAPLLLDYDLEPYINHCRPGVDPCPCDDCEYNEYGHTKPMIAVHGQVIYYRIPPSTPALKNAFQVKGGGAQPVVTLLPDLKAPADITVTVLNPLGTILYRQFLRNVRDRPITIDLSSTPGRYQLKVETPEGIFRQAIEAGMKL